MAGRFSQRLNNLSVCDFTDLVAQKQIDQTIALFRIIHPDSYSLP